MSMRHLAVFVILSAATSGIALASDFEVTIRAHADRIQLGDPLYLECTVKLASTAEGVEKLIDWK